MGTAVLVLGDSGTGKSYSLRNFRKGEVGVFSVTKDRLPFRSDVQVCKTRQYETIKRGIATNNLRCYVVDDADHLMVYENFSRADEKGYDKYTQMARSFERLLEVATDTDPDTIVYLLMHYDRRDDGSIKARTIGRMLDEKLPIESLVPITLMSVRDEDGFRFLTQPDVGRPTKSPPDMFEPAMDNDLKAVDAAIREYWGMKPLVDEGGAE